MINIGIIGCGSIAQGRHIPEYAANPAATLVGFYNPTFSRAEEMAHQYGGTAYATVDELLANPAIDAVSICTANIDHAISAIKAMKAGKHVLCEKPMAITIEECEEMVRVSDETGKKLMIAQNQRYMPAHVKAKELLQAGIIGELITFRATFSHGGSEQWTTGNGTGSWFFDAKRAAYGSVADLGIHKADLINFLTDRKITDVLCKTMVLDKKTPEGTPVTVDDNAMAIYTLEGDVMGTITTSWTNYGYEDNTEVFYGTGGVMYIDPNKNYIRVEKRIDNPAGKGPRSVEVEEFTVEPAKNSGIIDAFIDCLESGSTPPVDSHDVLHTMKMLLRAVDGTPLYVK